MQSAYRSWTRLLYVGLLLCSAPALAVAQSAGSAGQLNQTQAPDTSYECALSGSASGNLLGCNISDDPVNAGTATVLNAVTRVPGNCTNANFCGVRSEKGTNARVPVNAWGICSWIDNKSNDSIFVPFKTSNEWALFVQSAQNKNIPNITLTDCAVPVRIPGSPGPQDTVADIPYLASGCTGNTVADNTVLTPDVYGRTGVSIWPTIPFSRTFWCHNGGTKVMGLINWNAGDVQTTPVGQLSWIQNFKYSPDLLFQATDMANNQSSNTNLTITAGDKVRLTFSTTGTTGNYVNWNGPGDPFVTPTNTTIYSVDSTDPSSGLISTASVKVIVPGQCGADAVARTTIPIALCGTGNTPSPLTPTSSGWTWICTPVSGGGSAKTCSAGLQAASCNSGVQVDNSGNITNGISACAVGAASVIDSSGNYTCTTGDANSAAHSTQSCAAVPANTCVAGP